ncbi:toll/interleukin-1 receptor domain-containing protein [Amycolatopsis kentuckyensis]|uniref:toll/interleukin-1 receptor domain-containing protein n=1 Tax=Amycolatopsis kentuckyensis TaxID=218823 RepID=UPI0035627BAA
MQSRPINVFVGYAREDARHLETFCTYTAGLKRDNVHFFDDRAIPAGQNWKEILLEKLNNADITVFLITPNFIRSTFCMDHELAVALGRQTAGKCKVIPLHVSPFDLSENSPLKNVELIPSGKPIVTRHSAAKQLTWAEVAKVVRQTVESLRVTEITASSSTENSPHRRTPHNRQITLFSLVAALVLLAATASSWKRDSPSDDSKASAATPSASTEGNDITQGNTPSAPSQNSCIANTTCRYLRLSPGQGFNLDNWRTEGDPTVTLLADGGLGVAGTAKIARSVEPSRLPANPLPCRNSVVWARSIPRMDYNEAACVETPNRRYYLLIHLQPATGQPYEKFLASGFPK